MLTLLTSIVKAAVDFRYASRDENDLREREIDKERLEAAKKALLGLKTEAEEVNLTKNRRGHSVLRRSWSPAADQPLSGLVYISHGYTEHSGNYNGVAEVLVERGFRVISGDFIGHGGSEKVKGLTAYIPDFEECVEDIRDYIMDEKRRLGNLSVFGIGHSMGGMILIRVAMRHSKMFDAIVLDGPLIYPGSSAVLRNLPVQHLLPGVNSLFQFAKKRLGTLMRVLDSFQLGSTRVDNITSDPYMQELLRQDELRHFGGIYVGMLANFCEEMNNNLEEFEDKMDTPFLILFGQKDALCNVKGAWDMLFLSRKVEKVDKAVIEFEHGGHQLYLEIPQIREKAIKETIDFFLQRAQQQQE